jgi:hypothetical protein
VRARCSVPRCPVRVPPCECQVSVSVGLCALLVLPSLVNFGGQVQVKSKSSPSQVESGRAIPRGPNLPIGLLPPFGAQYPFLHTIQANLTPPASSFPFGQRFEFLVDSHSLEIPFSRTQFPPKVLTVLTWALNPPTASSFASPCCYHWVPSTSPSPHSPFSYSSSSSSSSSSSFFLTLI